MENKLIQFGIQSIAVTSFEPFNKSKEFLIAAEDVVFGINVNFTWTPPSRTITIICTTKFNNKKTDETLTTLVTNNIFIIENFAEVIKIVEGQVQTPTALLIELTNISVNTARGYFLAKNEGTPLSHIVMGAFNAVEIIAKMQAEHQVAK